MPVNFDRNRFSAALARFEQAHREDPARQWHDGSEVPAASVYAQRMTAWLQKLAPDSSEALRLAANCQHIRRWEIPRQRYPMTRAGYHQWRNALARFHADVAAQILGELDYDEVTITRVQSLLRKENLKEDPEMQMLEDVICLVFLEGTFSEFAARHEDAKVISILRKTWVKMTPRGRELALSLELPSRDRALIEKALQLQQPPPPGEPTAP